MTTVPDIGAFIIGDEILSGKRADKHLARLIETLKQRGLSLAWASYLGDDPVRITAALRRSFATPDIVFAFGGIGATPDDHTRQCAAAALGVPLARHPEAVAAMRSKENFELTENRLRMADFPEGAAIIPNPYNQIAAFSCGDHHFLPGFPEMAWPMTDWVLDTRYRHLFHQAPSVEEAILIPEVGESFLVDAMERVVAAHPAARLSSLPQHLPAGRVIELSFRGDPASVPPAMAMMKAELDALGVRYQVK